MTYILIPLVIILVLLLLFGLVVLLGRFRGGKYLRPIVATLSKVPFLRRFFERISSAALERQNPDLASALKKIQRVGSNPNPQQVQKALSRLSPAERRAYMEAVEEQGAMPEAANRQQRRQQQKMQQPARPGGGGRAGRRGGKKRK